MSVILTEAIPPFLQEYLGPPDERVKNWLFLNTPLWLVGILGCYFVLLVALVRIMEKRTPFQLRRLMIVYNTFQVLYSAYICKEIGLSAYLAGYKLACTDFDMSSTKLNIRMAAAFWCFYVSKIIDLCDTVFFVLRKKKNQLTFLHIYHHSSMIFNWYLGTLYLPGGQGEDQSKAIYPNVIITFILINILHLCISFPVNSLVSVSYNTQKCMHINSLRGKDAFVPFCFFSVLYNSFVHVIMYLYYLLAAIGPQMQKYLWWKKYLTQIQLMQFLMVMMHIIVGYRNGCKAPIWLTWFTVSYLWTLVVLFGNFYYTAYRTKTVKKRPALSKGIPVKKKVDIKAGGDFKIE